MLKKLLLFYLIFLSILPITFIQSMEESKEAEIERSEFESIPPEILNKIIIYLLKKPLSENLLDHAQELYKETANLRRTNRNFNNLVEDLIIADCSSKLRAFENQVEAFKNCNSSNIATMLLILYSLLPQEEDPEVLFKNFETLKKAFRDKTIIISNVSKEFDLIEDSNSAYVPETVAKAIFSLPEYLPNEFFSNNFQEVYLALSQNIRIIEYKIITSVINEAKNALSKYEHANSEFLKIKRDLTQSKPILTYDFSHRSDEEIIRLVSLLYRLWKHHGPESFVDAAIISLNDIKTALIKSNRKLLLKKILGKKIGSKFFCELEKKIAFNELTLSDLSPECLHLDEESLSIDYKGKGLEKHVFELIKLSIIFNNTEATKLILEYLHDNFPERFPRNNPLDYGNLHKHSVPRRCDDIQVLDMLNLASTIAKPKTLHFLLNWYTEYYELKSPGVLLGYLISDYILDTPLEMAFNAGKKKNYILLRDHYNSHRFNLSESYFRYKETSENKDSKFFQQELQQRNYFSKLRYQHHLERQRRFAKEPEQQNYIHQKKQPRYTHREDPYGRLSENYIDNEEETLCQSEGKKISSKKRNQNTFEYNQKKTTNIGETTLGSGFTQNKNNFHGILSKSLNNNRCKGTTKNPNISSIIHNQAIHDNSYSSNTQSLNYRAPNSSGNNYEKSTRQTNRGRTNFNKKNQNNSNDRLRNYNRKDRKNADN